MFSISGYFLSGRDISSHSPRIRNFIGPLSKKRIIYKEVGLDFQISNQGSARPLKTREWRGTAAIKELNAALSETDPELFYDALLTFGIHQELAGRVESAAQVYSAIAARFDTALDGGASPFAEANIYETLTRLLREKGFSPAEVPAGIVQRARRHLDAISGHGGFGSRAEFLIGRFIAEAADPGTLLAMGIAGSAFQVSRMAMLGRLTQSSHVGFLTRGFGARAFASAVGFAIEAPAFALTGMAANEVLGRRQDWDQGSLTHHLASSYLILGGMKLAGWMASSIGPLPFRISKQLHHQGAMLSGILLGEALQERLGFRPREDRSTPLLDSLVMLLQFNIAGSLTHRAFGRYFSPSDRPFHRYPELRGGPFIPASSHRLIPALGFQPSAEGVATLNEFGTSHNVDHILLSKNIGSKRRGGGNLSVRTLKGGDYQAISDVNNALYPERPWSVSEIRFEDSIRDPRCFLKRWVAERSSREVGFAELTQSSEIYHPNRYILRLGVLPKYQNRGIGTALYNEVADTLRSLGDISVRALVREDMSGAFRFMDKRGFRAGMSFSDYLLDLEKMKLSEISRRQTALKWRGTIKTMGELSKEGGRDKRLFELEKTVQMSTPYPEPLDSLNFEYFQRAILGNPHFLADGYFVAVEGERYLGVCSLYCREKNKVAYVRLSGVVPDRRGEGIATALKNRALTYAKQKGFHSVMTRNENTNSPILAINKNANFKHFSTWVHMSRSSVGL